ncbi:unnamed protein product [marine sediment metagenome]|uniref:Uncharacterized protein n=1 Tax=marine sediment metagenome TaxID=412755 RepID=X0X0Q1_9ZZZZ
MNISEILPITSHKMTAAAYSCIGIIRVCWLQGKIQCLDQTDRRAPEIVFGRYKADKIREGLTSKEWDKLAGSIRYYMEKKNPDDTIKALES